MQTQESGLQIPCSPCNTLPPPNPHHGHLLRLPYKISKEVEFILFVIHIPQEYKLHEADLFLPCVQRLILQFLQQCPAHSKCKINIHWMNKWMNEWIEWISRGIRLWLLVFSSCPFRPLPPLAHSINHTCSRFCAGPQIKGTRVWIPVSPLSNCKLSTWHCEFSWFLHL